MKYVYLAVLGMMVMTNSLVGADFVSISSVEKKECKDVKKGKKKPALLPLKKV